MPLLLYMTTVLPWIGGNLTNSPYARLVAGLNLDPRASGEMVRWGHDSDWSEIRFVSWGWGAAVGTQKGRIIMGMGFWAD